MSSSAPDPHYEDAESDGEAKMMRAEEHICGRCIHAQVCAVAAAVDQRDELRVAIVRCRAFIDLHAALQE